MNSSTSPFDYFLNAFKEKYADFNGRARRSEYWYFTLFNFITLVVAMIIDTVLIGYPILYLGYFLVSFIPSLAVLIRRLHDTNKSGWYFLISFIPLLGAIAILVFLCQDSDPGENQYGLNPKDPYADDDIAKHLVE